jgi:hypothetical protein
MEFVPEIHSYTLTSCLPTTAATIRTLPVRITMNQNVKPFPVVRNADRFFPAQSGKKSRI